MPGLYTITTRAPGTLITALIYNSDHQNHVNARNATIMQSYSTSIAQMQITEDPFPSSVESPAFTLAGEIARLRFDIAAIKTSLSGGTTVPWYLPLTQPGFASIGARIRRTTTQSIPDSTNTTISFTGGTADFNSGVWSNGNPTKFTAPSTGFYYVAAAIEWQATAITGRRLIQVSVNGSTTNQSSVVNTGGTQAGSSFFQRQTVSGLLKLTAADFVEFVVFQNSTASQDLIAHSNDSIVGSMIFFGSLP
jgi:hypothetical protein